MKVRVIKVSECEVPKFKSGDWKTFKVGLDNPEVSLPIDYEIEGDLIGKIEVGGNIIVSRHKRNGVECFGMFCSSPITKIDNEKVSQIVETQNSVYLVSEI